MFTKKKKCGCCQVIAGEKYTGSKFICEACSENSRLTDEFTWYKILWEQYRAAKFFSIVYPILLIFNIFLNKFTLMTLIFSGFGFFAMDFFYRNTLRVIPVKMKESCNKMFLLKLSGKTGG